jgi:hypothetical protein
VNNIGISINDDRRRGGRQGWIDVRRPRPSKPRLKPLGTGALVVTVVAAAASVMLLRTNEPLTCERLQSLTIAAAPAIAPTIRAITDRDLQPPCTEIKVVARTAVETAEAIAVADGETPALWIPDSALWPRRAAQRAAPVAGTPMIEQREPLAISPLVLVTTGRNGAGRSWPDAPPVGWQDLAGGRAATISNPLTTTEGLTALAAVDGLASAPRPELAGTMLQVGRNAAPSIQAAYDRLGSGAEPFTFIATEQSVASHNRGDASVPAVASYPREGTIALEYPLVRVIEPDEPASLADLADRTERALRAPAAVGSLLAAGFRSPQGDLDPSIATALGVPPSKPALLPPPTAEQAADVLRTWSAVMPDSQTLVTPSDR